MRERTPDRCLDCTVALDIATNWSLSQQRQGRKRCIPCLRVFQRNYYLKHSEKRKTYAVKYYKDTYKAVLQSLRAEVIAAYGGHCTCCLEEELLFLAIDHIHNDGRAHREKLGRAPYKIYMDIKERNYPPEFQVLCMNCNYAKFSQGQCPHKTKLHLIPGGKKTVNP